MTRRAAKVDVNQQEIVRSLRQCGATVQHLHTLGAGCPDILVGMRGVNYLIELKVGNAKLTPDEAEFHLTWKGQIAIARTIDEALAVCGLVDGYQFDGAGVA